MLYYYGTSSLIKMLCLSTNPQKLYTLWITFVDKLYFCGITLVKDVHKLYMHKKPAAAILVCSRAAGLISMC